MDHYTPLLQPELHQKFKYLLLRLSSNLCAIRSVLHTFEWACTKPPVVTHTLFALDTFHALQCVHNPTKDSIVYVCLHAHALQITLH